MLVRPALDPRVPVAVQRLVPELAAVITPLPAGTAVTRSMLGGVRADKVQHSTAAGSHAVLFFHSGGYVVGSRRTHRGVAAHLSRAAGGPVHVLDYRKAPEHPYPAALEDALAAYRALLEQAPDPGAIALAGDSAGGGLVLALTLRLRATGEPLPAALGLMSPWLDLSLSGASITSNAGKDSFLRRPWIEFCAESYRGSFPVSEQGISPLTGDLAGLPPMIIQSAEDDLIRSDGDTLAERARAAGVEVDYRLFGGLWHDFHLHAGILRDADEAVADLGEALRERLIGPPAGTRAAAGRDA
jgi:acetyl esterase/lipase